MRADKNGSEVRGRPVALVTGAGRRLGIATAVALRLAETGWDVAFTHFAPYDARMAWGADDGATEELAKRLQGAGARACLIEADFQDVETPARAFSHAGVVPVSRGTGADSGLGAEREADPAAAVTPLYREHALGLTRLALVLVRDSQAAEDIVQDAFCGLHRRGSHLHDTDRALAYVRSAVLNGCRSEFRRRKTSRNQLPDAPAWSAESAALASEERREVLRALVRLPARQREALVLRYYLDLSEAETASAMRISRGTAKSNAARGIAALRQLLGEES
jgi:RNA polymerase sigma-70 factor (sigma-E family)